LKRKIVEANANGRRESENERNSVPAMFSGKIRNGGCQQPRVHCRREEEGSDRRGGQKRNNKR